jgi:hypothetical protein
MQQNVIERLASTLGSLYEDEEIFYDLWLTLEVVYTTRAQRLLYLCLIGREILFTGV